VQLVVRLTYAVLIVGIHHEDQTLGVLAVVAPQRPDLVPAADVPHGERDLLVLHRLHVETDSRDRGHDLAQLQLVQDGGPTGTVETDLRPGMRCGIVIQ
jgi:hypothetical protein